MILDNEGQRNLLLELIKDATIKGKFAKVIAILENSIEHASIVDDKPVEQASAKGDK